MLSARLNNTSNQTPMINEKRIILQHAGKINPLSIDEYLAVGGYEAFGKALHSEPTDLLKVIEQSGLKGRGGAGFPTGIKTQTTYGSQATCLKYVVCNADEGEPGTFKDRVIMERVPHQLIEGMLIAGLAVGASHGYIYIRGEYYHSIDILKHALAQAKTKGFIGNNILNTAFSFNIDLFIGAGSYLCGEELTLIESLEGKRGYPRIKPPFPAQKGLWQQPTLVNNVETLANLPTIITIGADKYRQIGTEQSPGTKLVCLSGDVNHPGTYEVEMGVTLKDIIFGLGGGIKNNKKPLAFLIGGAAGTFANIQQLNTKLGYHELKEQQLTLGSGAIMVFSEESNLTKTFTSILSFFKHESCGKCVPCRIGTTHIYNLWVEAENKSFAEKIDTLKIIEKISSDIANSSLCPLGQSPILPVRSFLNHCVPYLQNM